jgi:hypothetical protein
VRLLPGLVDRHEGLQQRASKRMQPPIRRHYRNAGNNSCFRPLRSVLRIASSPAESVACETASIVSVQISTGTALTPRQPTLQCPPDSSQYVLPSGFGGGSHLAYNAAESKSAEIETDMANSPTDFQLRANGCAWHDRDRE